MIGQIRCMSDRHWRPGQATLPSLQPPMRPPSRSSLRMSRRALVCAGAAVMLGACSRRRPDASPEAVVREWIERMQHVHGSLEDARAAYELLSQSAKANLDERARRASAATGRKMEPEQMIVPSRFSLRFVPRQYTSRVAGERAIVEAVGVDPETERASIPCVMENGVWRVDLQLPALAPVERRPDAGAP
jgi:hypothetical protein